MAGINVGVLFPVDMFPFSGHRIPFLGDLNIMGFDVIRFYTETECVTIHWFREEENALVNVDTRDRTIGKI